MFFIMGISPGQKKLNFLQTMICLKCQQFGRYEIFMTYTYFSLFFIPIFRWNREFFVKTSCCNTTYSIDKDLGKRILKGEEVTINEADLHLYNCSNDSAQQLCPACGSYVTSDFLYCPKCGTRL